VVLALRAGVAVTTRSRPRRLASYKAWSPARISRSAVGRSNPAEEAQPIESVNPSGTPRRRAGLRMHSRRSRSAMRSASGAGAVGQNDQKLVPAIAADAVVGPHPFGQAEASVARTASPAWWPHVSLMALEESTSIMMTLVAVPARRPWSSSSSRNWMIVSRFHRPVSPSLVASS